MLALPIFIVQVMSYAVAPGIPDVIKVRGEHADEYETSLMLHLTPHLVAPLDTAGDGETTPSKLPAITNTPGVWAPRDWAAFTKDTGVGDPRGGTAEKGKKVLEMVVEGIVPVLTQLSAAQRGDFPFVIPER
jgi:creatinine amidohydrolase